MTPRELVYRTLEFRNNDGRVPRQKWMLPWPSINHPDAVAFLKKTYPDDIVSAPCVLEREPMVNGDPYVPGESVDAWGCKFVNIQLGIHGEVKEPIVPSYDEGWDDLSRVHIPVEQLNFDVAAVNKFCAETDEFVFSGACPRPFEQLQFIRGSEYLLADLSLRPKKMLAFIGEMHEFYCAQLKKWAATDVDALNMMDDWGAQRSLLISPSAWREIFKPMYADYIDIAHKNGKKMFMHSDGYTAEIIDDLIELKLDAFNTQIFCIGVDKLAKYRGKLTFWGEIDRQHILPYATEAETRAAVRSVYDNLWDNGGCIAQCEFGIGSKPENVFAVYDEWNKLRA